MILDDYYDSYTLQGYIGKECLPEDFFSKLSNYSYLTMGIIYSDLCMMDLGLIYRINEVYERIEIFARFYHESIQENKSLSISFQVIVNINNSNYIN